MSVSVSRILTAMAALMKMATSRKNTCEYLVSALSDSVLVSHHSHKN